MIMPNESQLDEWNRCTASSATGVERLNYSPTCIPVIIIIIY